MRFIRQVFTVAAKDLRSELRTKEAINAALSFSLVVLLLFSFAFDVEKSVRREIAGGMLWLVFAFAGVLLLNRSFARELPNDCLDALIASPVPSSALFLGKAIANYLLLLGIEAVSLPVFGVFYDVRWNEHLPELLPVLALASWGVAVVGTIFSALTVNLRLREVMLPMLVYPALVPCLIAAMQLTTPLVTGEPWPDGGWQWLQMIAGFDIIFTSLAVVLVDLVLVG